MIARLTRWMGVLVAAGAMVAPAQAQDDPGQVVRRCVNAMQETARHTAGAIHDITAETVARIERLDNGDASDDRIIAAGEAGIEQVNRAARRGGHRVNGIADSCIDVLRDMTDERRYFMLIRRAQRGALAAIDEVRSRGVHRIRRAVREALDD